VRIAVVENDGSNPRYPYKPAIPLTVIVNPRIEPAGETTATINEGCLSVPDLRGDLERYLAVRVRYLDRDGTPREQMVSGLAAGTFQHEVDHLDGHLFLDRVTDPASFTTWEQFDRFRRDEFLARVAAIESGLTR
jgi:peptide deformylase